MKKRIICLLLICFALTGCFKAEKHALSEKQIRKILEKDNSSSLKLVNTVTYAKDNATINDLKVSVEGENITLGEYKTRIQGEKSTLITGYYNEEGQTYYLYRLSTNLDGTVRVWETAKGVNDSFENVGWIATFVENPSDLVLVRFNKIDGINDDDYKEYRIYAIVDKDLVLVR